MTCAYYRRRFFAAVVGGSVAPKVATLPHHRWPTVARLPIAAMIRAQQAAMDRHLNMTTDIFLRSAPIGAQQFRLPISFKGPKP